MLLSEMFGVKRETDFGVEGYTGIFKIILHCNGTERLLWRLKDDKVYINADLNVVYDIIFKAPSGIIHLPPPLTDEQREQLKAIWTLGGRWLVRDIYKDVRYFNEIPHKSKTSWQTGNNYEDAYYGYRLYNTLDIHSLVSWSDPEPYDIGKALGVEK